MNTETRTCQNCKAAFNIEPVDFDFYAKVAVPPPTFCPQCRFQRRLMFRNERVFYRRECGLCSKSIITIFAPDKPQVVYCQPCWWSDQWDASDYGMDYDPSRNFFEQYAELQKKVPCMALMNGYTTLVNSDYVNHAGNAKNCYLIFNADYNENVLYGTMPDNSKDSMDMNMLEGSELCYETINCEKCYKTFFSEDCVSCTDVYFSKNMSGCSNCFGCTNLRGKSYHIWNKPYSKEDYEAKIKEFKLDSYASIQAKKAEGYDFWKKFPHKSMQGIHNVNVSGDYVWESRNARDMYQCRYVEDGRYCQIITLKPAKDVYDYTEWGMGAQRIYESMGVGEGADSVKFSLLSWGNVSNLEYCMYVLSSSRMFGCFNMKKKQYCILNKQYAEEEYEALRAQIIEDMNARPYVDSKGRIWKYGELFPYDLSLFDYNETHAIQYFPMDKNEASAAGLRWRDAQRSTHEITLLPEKVPDSILDTGDEILKEILGCASCGKAYRLVPAELELLRRFGFPIHRNCPDCRHGDRLMRTNPPRLWARTCSKCEKNIETSFAPDRPEAVYCENCYQNEVA